MNTKKKEIISLTSFVGNPSKIYKKECKVCEGRRKIKLVCDFIGLKKELNYRSKECKIGLLKPIN